MEQSVRALLIVIPLLIGFNAQAMPERHTETLGDETFDVWHFGSDDFRLYCKQPCEADEASVQAYYMNFRSYLPDLIDWHGVDVVEELKPVEMHLNESSICPFLSGAAGYAKIGYHRGFENARGVSCLFEIERGEDLAERNHVLSLHEYAHIILFHRHQWSYEYFTFWSSWELVEPDHPLADPCDDWYGQFDFTRPIHHLCRDFGLDKSVVRDSLIELDRRFRANEGFLSNAYPGGQTTTLAEMRGLFDAALNTDTAAAFVAGGVHAELIGVDFSIGSQAASYSAVDGRIQITVPEGALSETMELRLDKPGLAGGFLPPVYFPRIFAIALEDGDDSDVGSLDFDRPLRFAIQPESFHLNNRPHADYHLVQEFRQPGGQSYWRPIEGSGFDPDTGMVVGDINGTGRFAYGPKFRGPAGMFFDPAFNGHGFDIQMVGDELFVIFFTYDLDGQPFWLLGHAPLGNIPLRSHSAVEMDLWKYRNPDHDGSLEGSVAGHLQLQFFGGWDAAGWNIRANAMVSLDGITNDADVHMALEPLGFGNAVGADKQVTGHWFAPTDSGWGLTIDRKGETEVAVAYFYDADGNPRWALGNREINEPVTQVLAFEGYCLSCPPITPSFDVSGTVALDFDSNGRSGTVDLDVAWPATADQRWHRPNATLAPLSDPPEFRYIPESTAAGAAERTALGPPAQADAFGGKLWHIHEPNCLHLHHPDFQLGVSNMQR